MSNTSNLPAAQVAPAPAPESQNLPGAAKFKALITEGSPNDFDITATEEMLDIMEQVRGQDIQKSEPSSINMVTRYLKFGQLKGIPQRRFFMGWTARPLVDYKTKGPICDENTGEQIYGPAVIFYNSAEDQMEINQAFEIVKCFHEHRPPKGQMVEITFMGLVPTERGNNRQTFKILFLK